MRVHIIQHVSFEGPGALARIFKDRGDSTQILRMDRGDSLPSPGEAEMVVVLGGPMGVGDETLYPWLAEEKLFLHQVIRAGTPVLGICLGAQLVASVLGARVSANREKEIGWFPIYAAEVPAKSPLTLPQELTVFHWHGDTFTLPSGALPLASSQGCDNQAFLWGGRVIGLQFHLEMTPDSVRELVHAGRNELVSGRFIQTEAELLSLSGRDWAGLHGHLTRLIAFLTA